MDQRQKLGLHVKGEDEREKIVEKRKNTLRRRDLEIRKKTL